METALGTLPPVSVPGSAEDELMDEEFDEEQQEDEIEDDSDEEYNHKMYGMYQALPVEGEPDWSEAEPSTAEEYLRRVQHERARCAAIVRVEVDASKLQKLAERQQASEAKQQQNEQAKAGASQQQRRARGALPPQEDISEAPDWAQPNTAWLQNFVSSFEALRLELQQADHHLSDDVPDLPDMEDTQAWNQHCFGRNMTADGGAEECSPVVGTSSIIHGTVMQLDTIGVAELFARHVQQLTEQQPKHGLMLRAQWLFALSARLEKPLLPDTLAALRSLLRHCAKLRAGLQQSDAGTHLPVLSMLIAIAGAYFGQDEHLCKLASPDFQALA